MPMEWISPAVQSGGSMANQFIVGLQTRQNMKQQNQWNREMAEMEFQRNLDMWNRNNAYNAPQAQMERLKAAGLNPNLVYGTGTVSGNTSGQIPKYQAPQMRWDVEPLVQVPDVIGKFMDLRMKQAQIDQLQAQTDTTKSMAALNVVKKLLLDPELGYASENAFNRYRKLFRESELVGAKEVLVNTQGIVAQAKAKRAEQLADQEVRMREAQITGKQLENTYNMFRNDFAKIGVMNQDHFLVRIIARFMQDLGVNIHNIF